MNAMRPLALAALSMILPLTLSIGAAAAGPVKAAPPVKADPPVKTATVDLLLQRRHVGAVVIDDARGQVYFELSDPDWSPDGGYAVAISPSSSDTKRKKIYVAPMDGAAPARPLFDQAADDSYAFARNVFGLLDVMSPGGRYLAIHHLKDGTERIGIYDLTRQKFSYVKAEVEQGIELSTPIWTGKDELSVAVNDDSYTGNVIVWDNIIAGRNIAAAREAGWRDGDVTTEIVGGGKYGQRKKLVEKPVIRINVLTGKTHRTTVKEADIYWKRATELRLKGVENTYERLKPNSEALNPPKPRTSLLASSERGKVFLIHDQVVGSRLEFVPTEIDAAPVLLFEYNTHLEGVKTAVGPIVIEHEDYAGEMVKSWLFLPPGASIERPEAYPLVVIPYPGMIYDEPFGSNVAFARYIWTLNLVAPVEMEVFASEGYGVLLPSIPFVRDEGPAEPMSRVMYAINAAVDSAIETGFVDSERLALAGHSFGGYAALSVAVQSDRFQAIISAMLISNIVSFNGTFPPLAKVDAERHDYPGTGVKPGTFLNRPFKLGTHPWNAPDRSIRNSPLFFVENVSTPILLIGGDLDSTTHITQAEEIFSALYFEEKDVKFIKYFGEHHLIEQPQNQRHMWHQVFSFLDENLLFP